LGGRIILKWILYRVGSYGLDWSASGHGQVDGSCERGNEPSGSHRMLVSFLEAAPVAVSRAAQSHAVSTRSQLRSVLPTSCHFNCSCSALLCSALAVSSRCSVKCSSHLKTFKMEIVLYNAPSVSAPFPLLGRFGECRRANFRIELPVSSKAIPVTGRGRPIGL
jgi:hypothetical protein